MRTTLIAVVTSVALFAGGTPAARGAAQPGTWRGVVASEQGVPIEGAVITARMREGTRAWLESARTGSDGTFVMPLVMASAEAMVSAYGYSAWMKRVTLADATSDARILLQPAGTIQGRILDANRAPARGLLVDVGYDLSRLPFAPPIHPHGGRLITRGDGSFAVSNVITGVPFRVQITSATNVVGEFGPYVIAPGARQELELFLPRAGSVSGVVRDEAGRLLRDVSVRVVRDERGVQRYSKVRPTNITVRTDPQGTFAIDALLPGRFLLVVNGRGHRGRTVPLVVGPGGHVVTSVGLRR